jgi:two-component system chemotaxis response regulator CheB
VAKVRVLIVDDSALVRKLLREGMSSDPDIEVIGEASNPYTARDLLVELRPDVITLDVEMPRMDGVTFLRNFMPILPTPTVMISSLTEEGKRVTLDALQYGAVDVILKPKIGLLDNLPVMMQEINHRIKSAAKIDVSRFRRKASQEKTPIITPSVLEETTDKIMAIGASTGGVEALSRILPHFPAASPGIVMVQHMPPGFTTTFADRLNKTCQMRVKEAENGDRVQSGLVLLAPGGDQHMILVRSGGEYRVRLIEGPPVQFSRPAVDPLFFSVAKEAGRNATAVLMTGMGKDGAEGLLAIKNAGGRTFAQDANTCVVFGMPKIAMELGAAERMVPLEAIPSVLINAFKP